MSVNLSARVVYGSGYGTPLPGISTGYAIDTLAVLIIPISLTAGRLAIRWQIYGRLFWDDVACSIALLSTIVYAALQVASYHDAQYIEITGVVQYSLDREPLSMAGEVATSFFFFVALWAMDMCILLLYRDLFWVSGKFRKFWYAVVGYLILTVVTSTGLLLSLFGSQMDEIFTIGNARPALVLFINVPTNIIVLLFPACAFPSIHLRHSINWGIAWMFCVGGAAFSFSSMYALGSKFAVVGGTWGLYLGTSAASMAAYSPLIMPEKRQNLWPWSRKSHIPIDTERQLQTAKRSKPSKIARMPTFSSMLSLIRQGSSSKTSLTSIELDEVRSSFEGARRNTNGRPEHGQVRRLEMRF